jgi:hypothetical protein
MEDTQMAYNHLIFVGATIISEKSDVEDLNSHEIIQSLIRRVVELTAMSEMDVKDAVDLTQDSYECENEEMSEYLSQVKAAQDELYHRGKASLVREALDQIRRELHIIERTVKEK